MGLEGNCEMELKDIAEERGCSLENIRKAWNKALDVMKKEPGAKEKWLN